MPEEINVLTIDLSKKLPARTVTIEGVKYTLLSADDFGLRMNKKMFKTASQIKSFLEADVSNDEKLKSDALAKLRGFVKSVLPELPDAILFLLPEAYMLKLMTVFTKAVEDFEKELEANPTASEGETASESESAQPTSRVKALKAVASAD